MFKRRRKSTLGLGVRAAIGGKRAQGNFARRLKSDVKKGMRSGSSSQRARPQVKATQAQHTRPQVEVAHSEELTSSVEVEERTLSTGVNEQTQSEVGSKRPSAWTTPMPCKACVLIGYLLIIAGIGMLVVGATSIALISLGLGIIITILNAIRGVIVVRNRKRRFWR